MWRSVAEERGWSSLARLALLLLGSVSVLLWAVGNGVPYGYDSSGTYLTYRAAYNAVTFPRVDLLVADISVSPDATDHPAFDLNRPNVFGQVLSQLLIRAGVTELAAHTALAIGVSALGGVLAIKVLTRLGGPALAAATMLLFALQYVGVLTWTTNLQAALHFPLFWGNLYLLQRYADRPSRARLAAVAAGLAAIFVNDLALGAFVLLTEVLLFWQLSRPVRPKLLLTLSAIVGAVIGVLLLVVVAGPGVVAALLPIDLRDQWLQIPSAFRAMFGLGQGALTVVVFGVLLAEVARAVCSAVFRGRVWRLDLGVLLALIVSVSVALLLDRSTSLIDDWELLPGRAVTHVGLWLALIGLLLVVAVRLWRGQVVLSDPFELATRGDALTARSFVLAVGLAAVVLILLPVGDFVDTYVRNYQPALVFLEDVILAIFALALIGKLRESERWSVSGIAIVAVLLVIGSYWVAYQGRLVMRYPPREIPIASALRGNVPLDGATFVAPDLPQVVWYYTRGRAVTDNARASDGAGPAFVVCARVPTSWPAPVQCGPWTPLLDSAATAVGPGRALFRTPDYDIYDLPPCAAPRTSTACGAQPDSPPGLEPLGDAPDAPTVDLTVTLQPTQSVAHVDYRYSQEGGSPEADSVVQLYVLRSNGNWCLIEQTAGSHDIQFRPASGGQFRAAVIPRSTLAIGQPYFSNPLSVQTPYVVDLPNTRDGGTQHIEAASVEDAEQQALAAGTWNPGAGTLGPDSRHLLVDAPSADQQCRH